MHLRAHTRGRPRQSSSSSASIWHVLSSKHSRKISRKRGAATGGPPSILSKVMHTSGAMRCSRHGHCRAIFSAGPPIVNSRTPAADRYTYGISSPRWIVARSTVDGRLCAAREDGRGDVGRRKAAGAPTPGEVRPNREPTHSGAPADTSGSKGPSLPYSISTSQSRVGARAKNQSGSAKPMRPRKTSCGACAIRSLGGSPRRRRCSRAGRVAPPSTVKLLLRSHSLSTRKLAADAIWPQTT